VLKAAVRLASVSLVMALPAAASGATAAKSFTIRVYVHEVTRSIKDVPPKTLAGYEYTKGDTIRGTESLRNAVPQVNGKPGSGKVPIVGGTGLYAGATGVAEGRHLANGQKLNIHRFQIP
jgi:hypothetical protein